MPRINYEIAADLHRQAKATAALQGVTLHDFVIEALEQAVKNATGTKPGRR